MSHAPHLPAPPSEPSEPVAAETDYEALTDALMQTRRGRWFLTEHARRCREADNADLRAALARIEQVLAEPREPAGLAELQEKLEVLPRIEQALAEPREPARLAEIQETLGALPRIEQALAEPREISGIVELHERVATFAQTLEGVRADVAAQRPAEPDEEERARDRHREEEMLRLLHEQRQRLDALADIWARVASAPTVPEPTVSEPAIAFASVAEAAGDSRDSADDHSEPTRVESQPAPAMDLSGIGGPAPAEGPGDRVEPDAARTSMPFDTQMPTADLLNQTLTFAPGVEAPLPAEGTAQPDAREDDGATLDLVFDPSPEERDESPAVPDVDPAVQASAEPASEDDQAASAVLEVSPPATSADPIVQMFIDAETPAASAAGLNRAEPADMQDASPWPERAKLPAWLVGAADSEAQSLRPAGIDTMLGDIEMVPVPADVQPASDAVIDEDAALFEAEAMPKSMADAEADMAAPRPLDSPQEAEAEKESCAQPIIDTETQPAPASAHHIRAEPAAISSTEDMRSSSATAPLRSELPDLTELTLDLLQKALSFDPARAGEPAPADAPTDLDPGDSFATAVAQSDLRAAIAALRRVLGREDNQPSEAASVSELVILNDMPVRPPPLATLQTREPEAPARAAARAPEPAASTAADPLAPVNALSEEERIALFS